MNEFLIERYIEPLLDKATAHILQDWNVMEERMDEAPEKIWLAMERMTSIRGFNSATPVQGGGNKREEMLAQNLDVKILAEKGVEDAKAYFACLMPAWNSLTDDEKYVLRERFIEGGNGLQRIMSRRNIEKSAAYNMCNSALKKLRKKLFW